MESPKRHDRRSTPKESHPIKHTAERLENKKRVILYGAAIGAVCVTLLGAGGCTYAMQDDQFRKIHIKDDMDLRIGRGSIGVQTENGMHIRQFQWNYLQLELRNRKVVIVNKGPSIVESYGNFMPSQIMEHPFRDLATWLIKLPFEAAQE